MVKMPLLANDGRTVLHPCITLAGARRYLMQNLGDHSTTLVKKHRFELRIWERTPLALELGGGLQGWMYSIGK